MNEEIKKNNHIFFLFSKILGVISILFCFLGLSYLSLLKIEEINKNVAEFIENEKVENCKQLNDSFERRRCLILLEIPKSNPQLSLYERYKKAFFSKETPLKTEYKTREPESIYSKKEIDAKFDELQESVHGQIQNSMSDEFNNQSNCESNGGSYNGNGSCSYY